MMAAMHHQHHSLLHPYVTPTSLPTSLFDRFCVFSCGSVFGRFFVFPVASCSVVFVVFGRDAYVVFGRDAYAGIRERST